MLVDTERTLVFRCSACGSWVERGVSIFWAGDDAVRCECGAPAGRIRRVSRAFHAVIRCVACEGAHAYHIRTADLAKRSVIPLSCHESHFAIGYIGEDEAVRDALLHQDSLENLVFDPDYADFFDHPQVMYETLALIQAKAEVGRLGCACGSDRIEVDVANDRVRLLCADCGGSAEFAASCDDDLSRVRAARWITLSSPEGMGSAPEDERRVPGL